MKTNLLIWYPRCSTCKNVKKWLEDNNINFETRDIIQEVPTVDELENWIKQTGYPIKKFFNTSGLKYKELNLKEKLPQMTEKEQIELLSSDGMLIKRPLLITKNTVLVGFKKDEWEENLK